VTALYGDGDGTYTVRDTVDNVVGDCSFVENRQVLSCGTEFGPYEGIEFVNCKYRELWCSFDLRLTG
jgi:hypothetical protein